MEITNISHLIQEKEIHKCEICQKNFCSLKNLRKHIKLHSSNRDYICNICYKTYKRSDHLSRHLLIHQKDSNIFQCPYCTCRFYLKYHLKSHINNIHTTNLNKYKCSYCDLSFPKKRKLNKHIKNDHKENTKENNIKCYYPYCIKNFSNQNLFDLHIVDEHGFKELKIDEEKPIGKEEGKTDIYTNKQKKKALVFFKCPYQNCLKVYTTEFNLDVHIKSKHLQLKEFICEICGEKFSHKCSLKRHKDNQHIIKESNIELDKVDEN